MDSPGVHYQVMILLTAILFALGVLLQGTTTVPRPPQPSTQSNKESAADSQQAPNPSPTVGEPHPATNIGSQNSKTVEPTNNEGTVRIVSLPPITTTRDVPTFIISVILAVVGIIGIIVAICTVRIIKRQTEHIARQAQSMRYQTTHLKNAAVAAKLSADASKRANVRGS